MRVISLINLLEAAVALPDVRNATGTVANLETLLTPETFLKLEASHPGIFAFVAFHPQVDTSIKSYVLSGSLASDTNPSVLALLIIDGDARWPARLAAHQLQGSVKVDPGSHPANSLLHALYGLHPQPPLPGIVFFEKFSDDCEPVYVFLNDCTSQEVATARCRTAFAVANRSCVLHRRKPDLSFASVLAVELAKSELKYERTARTSLMEWIIKTLQFLRDHRADIVSAIKLIPGPGPSKRATHP